MCLYKIIDGVEKTLKGTWQNNVNSTVQWNELNALSYRMHFRFVMFLIYSTQLQQLSLCRKLWWNWSRCYKSCQIFLCYTVTYLAKHEYVAKERYWLWMFDATSRKSRKWVDWIPRKQNKDCEEYGQNVLFCLLWALQTFTDVCMCRLITFFTHEFHHLCYFFRKMCFVFMFDDTTGFTVSPQ